MPIIDVQNLCKEYKILNKESGITGMIKSIVKPRYSIKQAVKDISFSIEEGEMVGYIGANGAGKSTTIKMLTGILTPTSGKVLVNGIIPYKKRIQNNSNIGAVFGQRTQMWWDIAPIESFKLTKKIYDMSDKEYKFNLEMFTELLDLKDIINIPVRQLSLGQKMRCEIAMTFLHNPKIVYLDEPTIGLDIMVKDTIRECIKTINKEKNVTIILTTHDMQDIESIANRIILIDKGEKVYDGGIEKIKNEFGQHRIVNISGSIEDKNILNIKHKGVKEIIFNDNQLQVKFNSNRMTAKEVINIFSQGYDIKDFSIVEPTIESIVKDFYKV